MQQPYQMSGERASNLQNAQSAVERLQRLSEQRAAYNATMMRKAEDRYNAYMQEMQRRYEAANKGRPWWKKALGGLFGGAGMGALVGNMIVPGVGAAVGAGIGAAAGGGMGATGVFGETGMGGYMPLMSQAAMLAAPAIKGALASAPPMPGTVSGTPGVLAPGQGWQGPVPSVSMPVNVLSGGGGNRWTDEQLADLLRYSQGNY